MSSTRTRPFEPADGLAAMTTDSPVKPVEKPEQHATTPEHAVDPVVDRRRDEALGRAAALGDRGAFEILVNTHGPAMYRYARHILNDEGDAQEVVQDAFVAAWKGLPGFCGRSALRTWLFSLTAHKAIDVRRKSRAQPVDHQLLVERPADHFYDPVATMTSAELVSAVERALLQLPYRQRACWLLIEVEGMSQQEAAEALSMSPGAVRGQLSRARRNLAERMAQWR